jgi:hypothetical protein
MNMHKENRLEIIMINKFKNLNFIQTEDIMLTITQITINSILNLQHRDK